MRGKRSWPTGLVLLCAVLMAVEVQGDTEATIELARGGLLVVIVFDNATADRISGASVAIRSEGNQRSYRILTDEDGSARQRLLPGTYIVEAFKPGYPYPKKGEWVTVQEGMSVLANLSLGGSQKLTGKVVDAAGQPVEGARVQILPTMPSLADRVIETDANGIFKLGWDPKENSWMQGDYCLVVSQAAKHLAGSAFFAADTEQVPVTLSEEARAQGRVLNPDGRSVTNARMILYYQGDHYSSPIGSEARTDAEGRYELKGLPPEQRLTVHVFEAEGYGLARSNEIVARAGQTVEVEDLFLPVADQQVSGVVIDVDGKPLANVRVHGYGGIQPDVFTQTDEEGRFVLEGMCEGNLAITATYLEGGKNLHTWLETKVGAEDVRIVMGGESRAEVAPRKTASIMGKPFKEVLSANGVELPVETKSAVVFVWDMSQRPSRHFVQAFARQAARLKERGVTAVLLQAGATERSALDAWLKENGIDCPCGMIEGDVEAVKLKLGVRRLPWLIVTDGEGTVAAEGLSVEELEKILNSI